VGGYTVAGAVDYGEGGDIGSVGDDSDVCRVVSLDLVEMRNCRAQTT